MSDIAANQAYPPITPIDLAPQRIAKAIGAEGCYFLSLLELGRQIVGISVDAFKAYTTCVTKTTKEGKPYMLRDCYINSPIDVLSVATGMSFEYRKEPANYSPAPGEYVILRYELREEAIVKSHFVVGDRQGMVAWDPYGKSLTVEDGKLQSMRVFKVVRRG